jgi:hypothetical protein
MGGKIADCGLLIAGGRRKAGPQSPRNLQSACRNPCIVRADQVAQGALSAEAQFGRTRMTKRGVAGVVAAVLAMLAFAGAANAQSGRLSYKTAKRLAVTLAEKQVRSRDIVSYHLTKPKRLGPRKIAFVYDDRSETAVFCTAAIVVTAKRSGSTTRVSARFRRQACTPIPDDALAIEAATRNAARALRGTADDTEASLERVTRSIRRCEDLVVPRSRRGAVSAILDIAILEALEGPNDSVLGDFVAILGEIQTAKVVLQRGIAGWADYLAVVRSLPAIPDPCATLQRWAQADWAASESPIDLGAYRELEARVEEDQTRIERAARYLARVGVFPRAAVRFTPDGLLLRLAPSLG